MARRLIDCIRNDDLSALETMLYSGADPNKPTKASMSRGARYPIHIAAEDGALWAIDCLYDFGANMNVQLVSGSTPLSWAMDHQRINAIVLLIEYGADVNLVATRACCLMYERRFNINPGIIFALFLAGLDFRRNKHASSVPTNKSYAGLLLSPDGDHLHPDCFTWVRRFAVKCILPENAIGICIALQSLRLPALVTAEILRARLSMWPNMPYGLLWALVTTVKHFRERKTTPDQR